MSGWFIIALALGGLWLALFALDVICDVIDNLRKWLK